MKFKFKVQKYQTDAVNAITKVFEGQPYLDHITYTRDLGKGVAQQTLYDIDSEDFTLGFENADIVLSDDMLLNNINLIQQDNNIPQSESLSKEMGRVSLDIEMETGTGKTYVYIKSIYELNKKYGWTKFIIVVPSIAIREGVNKSFNIMEEHFRVQYGKSARYFIYNSSKLNDLDEFSKSADIQVMIINSQAFATSMNEDAKNSAARLIYTPQDSFNSRKPIDVIKRNRPILILDEPQKLGGIKTQTALKKYFNPLFSMNFSATHKVEHNKVYMLDAIDAFNKKLVKKIEVKGIEINNLNGANGYVYFSNVVLDSSQKPRARVEFEINTKSGIKRVSRILSVGDNLYHLSKGNTDNELEEYKNDYFISDIEGGTQVLRFSNGITLSAGEVIGDTSEDNIRRIQIRQTILSHLEKEKDNYNRNIKTLSLFFIDEVGKYRQYGDNGEELNGEYGKIFEEEYTNVLNEFITLEDTPYMNYLKDIDVKTTHRGYFSIDKKTNRMIDGTVEKRGELAGLSNDISAYDLILKNKERLLSFDEPTRFIFSHSALREGWDNPNVFQICTLKHSDSTITKRQEVGRGMRLCVNANGDRIDGSNTKGDIHKINILTVIASESYKDYVAGLQDEIVRELSQRPQKATKEYFVGRVLKDENGNKITLDNKLADKLHRYLIQSFYVDDNDKLTQKYKDDMKDNTFIQLPNELVPYAGDVHKLVQSVDKASLLADIIKNGNATKLDKNPLNENFEKAEFKKLWNNINHKYMYTINFDSDELVENAVRVINNKLFVSENTYTIVTGGQRAIMDKNQLERGAAFGAEKSRTAKLNVASNSSVKYDLIGKIAQNAKLTRKTACKILKGLQSHVFNMFSTNPEEFIKKVSDFIIEQKGSMVVKDITYNMLSDKYDDSIFFVDRQNVDIDKIYKAKKHIQDYVITDGLAKDSVEKKFAEELDIADEVCVYAKLPRGFAIPTPVGDYTPDWAIAFNDNMGIKHIYFIAETKGTMSSMQLREVEKIKIECAKKLFNEMSTSKVKYHEVKSYKDMLEVIRNL